MRWSGSSISSVSNDPILRSPTALIMETGWRKFLASLSGT